MQFHVNIAVFIPGQPIISDGNIEGCKNYSDNDENNDVEKLC